MLSTDAVVRNAKQDCAVPLQGATSEHATFLADLSSSFWQTYRKLQYPYNVKRSPQMMHGACMHKACRLHNSISIPTASSKHAVGTYLHKGELVVAVDVPIDGRCARRLLQLAVSDTGDVCKPGPLHVRLLAS